jgi:hypothetical protein
MAEQMRAAAAVSNPAPRRAIRGVNPFAEEQNEFYLNFGVEHVTPEGEVIFMSLDRAGVALDKLEAKKGFGQNQGFLEGVEKVNGLLAALQQVMAPLKPGETSGVFKIQAQIRRRQDPAAKATPAVTSAALAGIDPSLASLLGTVEAPATSEPDDDYDAAF